jgi:tetratricopeptide (TPR) repeat protein
LKQYNEAEQSFIMCMKFKKEDREAQFLYGKTLRYMGRSEDAMDTYEKILENTSDTL